MSIDRALRQLLSHYADIESEATAEGDEDLADEARRRRAVLSGWISWRVRQRNQCEDAARERPRRQI